MLFGKAKKDKDKDHNSCDCTPSTCNHSDGFDQVMGKSSGRRDALKNMSAGLLAGLGLVNTACDVTAGDDKKEKSELKWEEYFKGNYRLMTEGEKSETVTRLERLYELNTGKKIKVSTKGAVENVLFGYAFNISKCQGYMDCINACIEENNQDRSSQMQYIRIHEHKKGSMDFGKSDDNYFHEVPASGHFYMGTQCFHCENPPCVDVCPTKATWKEEDGIVVVDYDWCIGCRYCMAACPYDGRRFNWKDPEIPEDEVNKNQHYLGNRLRKKGVMEKCTFCLQRSRDGQNPACVEACPTGSRIFGNLLDPKSDIRWVLENKKVFRLKEDLGTEPKFWYFMD
jgi:Fe-S-cluster-containing dehydrogenase component